MTTPARLLALVSATVTLLLVTSATAWADEPASAAWPDGEGRSVLDTLILFGGGTAGLFVLLWLFGLMTARNNYVPPAPSTEIATTSDHTPAKH